MSENENQDIQEIEVESQKKAKPGQMAKSLGYKSKKALQARIENLRKGRELRLKKVAMKKREIPIDDDDESDYSDDYSEPESDSFTDSSEEIVLKKKPKSNKSYGRSKAPTKSELKMMAKMERIEKFMGEISKAKLKKKPSRSSNKPVVVPVYAPSNMAQQAPQISEKEKRDFIGMF